MKEQLQATTKTPLTTRSSQPITKPRPHEVLREKSVSGRLTTAKIPANGVTSKTNSQNINSQSTGTVAADSPEVYHLDGVEVPSPELWSKSEEQGMIELDLFARQQFLCGLDNQAISGPVSRAFPNMPKSHSFYRIAIKKTQDLYKNWKHRTLRAARTWISNFVKREIQKDPNFEETSRSFKGLKTAVNRHFRVHHLASVFVFASEAVDTTNCTPQGALFLRCKSDA
jgi:hypothetical protein